MGVSTAYHLARRGARHVVLLERQPQLGAGSTGRNAGGFRHQFSHEANIRLSIESIRVFERFREQFGVVIDLRQDGYLFLLSSEETVAAFRASVALQRRFGVDVQWLDPRQAAGLVPGLEPEGVLAATYCAADGIADPNGVTMGMAAAARAAGVEIRTGTEVVDLGLERGRITSVVTARGAIATPAVVDAAGPWAARIGRMANVALPVEPLRRHIFLAQPAGGGSWDAPALRGRVPSSRIMVIDVATSFYFHREGGRLLFGMGDAAERPSFDTSVNWDFLPQVVDVATHRLPVLADAEVSHAWAGLYEMTPDAMPIIGAVPERPGFYVVAGFSGHGFQHSPAAGRVLADLLTGRDPGCDVSPFAYERFAGRSVEGERHVV